MKRPIEMQQWIDAHPVWQARNSGKWGFARVLDCANLNRDDYNTKRGAVLARAKHAKMAVEARIAMDANRNDAISHGLCNP